MDHFGGFAAASRGDDRAVENPRIALQVRRLEHPGSFQPAIRAVSSSVVDFETASNLELATRSATETVKRHG